MQAYGSTCSHSSCRNMTEGDPGRARASTIPINKTGPSSKAHTPATCQAPFPHRRWLSCLLHLLSDPSSLLPSGLSNVSRCWDEPQDVESRLLCSPLVHLKYSSVALEPCLAFQSGFVFAELEQPEKTVAKIEFS
jgi:hypothetical protein